MRSGRIEEQDRVVWVGDPETMEPGSSEKAYEVTRTTVSVSWGGGKDTTSRRGTEVVSCKEAGLRGIEPWTDLL